MQPEQKNNLDPTAQNPTPQNVSTDDCADAAAKAQQVPDPASGATGRDPEDRTVEKKEKHVREKMMDKTLADSYPASDPPSSIPDPGEDDSMAA